MKNVYSAQLTNLKQIATDIEAFCEANNVPAKERFAINLAVDEMFTNVVSYGYKMDVSQKIEIQITACKNCIKIVISDCAPKFDPIEQVSAPDITTDLDNRRVGGLGVYFAKKHMDEIFYEYRDNKNIITMYKNLSV